MSPPSRLQPGVAAGLAALGRAFYADIARSYAAQRDRLYAAPARAGLTPHVPAGGYCVLADTSRVPVRTSKKRAMHLLDVTHHAPDGHGLARLCFVKADEKLEETCPRIERLA